MLLDSNTAICDHITAMGDRTKPTNKEEPESGSRHIVTSLRIVEDLHEKAKIFAIRKKTSLQAIVNEALAEYLKKHA